MTSREFGLRIKKLRERNGWTKRQLANYAVLHHNTIYSIEKGTASITLDTLNRLAVVFDKKPYQLLR